MRPLVLAAFVAMSVLVVAAPMQARHRDRDRPERGEAAREDGNGFYRYYGTEYGVTGPGRQVERRDRDWRDDPRERRHHDRTPRAPDV